MELKFDFDPKSKEDRIFIRSLSAALRVACDVIDDPKALLEAEAEAGSAREVESETAPTEEPVPVEEAPKRRARSKKKEESKAEPAQEEKPQDGASDLPFDNEPEPVEPVEEKPAFPTLDKDGWTEVNQAKRKELGLHASGAHADLIREFNMYCLNNCKMFFGADKPSLLPPEQLWQYAEWFKTIKMNPDYIPGSADGEHGCPFVSNAPSKE